MSDFYTRQFEQETKRKVEYARTCGYTVEELQEGMWRGIWRVYHGQQVALCTTETDAARVAYALAMLERTP